MARTVDLGITQCFWVPGDTGLTTPSAPKATEISAGKNISPYLVTTYDVGADASDTIDERAITDVANVVVPTVGNYHGTLVLFRDLTAGAPTADDPLTTIANAVGQVGWFCRRLGLPNSTAPASTQKMWEVYKFMTDTPQITGGTQSGYLKATIPLLQQGTFYLERTLAA